MFLASFMSSIFEYIQNNPQEAQRLVGLKYEQVQELLNKAIELHNQKRELAEYKKVRIILRGGGRKPKLSPEEQIILTLTYLRHLTTFQLLGIQFGVSETTANDTFNYWFPLLGELLPPSLLEQVKKNSSDYEIVQEILTDFELIVDSYEQPIERPGGYQEQKKYYSAKKANHTRKSQLIVLPNGKDIVDVVAGEPGPKSDINLFRETKDKFDEKQKFTGDKAYQGEELMKTPTKKPRKQELTSEQKEKNKELASERIFVEHLIRLVNIFRVAQERFRLNPHKYEQIIMIICGLVRLRIGTFIF
ncbi:transposase [Dolichospermum circinale]|uniref:transposase n=1 Tax=Dolichospermum circinale TaxID=109265 RepID=UPI00232E28A7|nr:transposase [Dolichospermum circinale]MDB9451572.1 transposase [Dolichospermum circinale CS-547]